MSRAHVYLLASCLLAGSLADANRLGGLGVATEAGGNGASDQDLINVQESSRPIECSGARQSELAPESKVVAIQFVDLLTGRSKPNLEQINKLTKNKQSQEFDTHLSNSSSSTTTSTTSTQPSSDDLVSSTSSTSSSTTSDNENLNLMQTTTTTEGPDVAADLGRPVASKTVRLGEQVFCGEANPNGKSNKRLALDRIVGGRKTEPGEFPFQVRLNIRSRRGSGICGGVILDERHILTAAHCMTACVSQYLSTVTIELTGVHATIGDHSIKANDGEIEIELDKITPHEKYDACNFYANDHDIALIKTRDRIEFRFTSDGYGSINRPCMPASRDLLYKESDSVIVSGWGVTRENSGALSNILRYVQVPIVNITKCQETYGSRVTNEHVCAGFPSGGRDSCQGDSGGPLVRVLENRYELVGIVSFGYGCGQPGAPGVYTRVASYIDWIKANL